MARVARTRGFEGSPPSYAMSFPRKRESSSFQDVDPRFRGGDARSSFAIFSGLKAHEI